MDDGREGALEQPERKKKRERHPKGKKATQGEKSTRTEKSKPKRGTKEESPVIEQAAAHTQEHHYLKAKHAFSSHDTGHLQIQKGDIILYTGTMSENWWMVAMSARWKWGYFLALCRNIRCP